VSLADSPILLTRLTADLQGKEQYALKQGWDYVGSDQRIVPAMNNYDGE
jgi:hypothetical protein